MFTSTTSPRVLLFALTLATLLLVGLQTTITGVEAAPPGASEPDSVVYPTGETATDVANIQSAIDEGGAVLLKSRNHAGEPTAFNFGPGECPGERVGITSNVSLIGEQDANARTTIRGGCIPILGTVTKTSLRVEGIFFDGPALSAIIVTKSSGAEIVGNEIADIAGVQLIFPPLTEGRGIKFLGSSDPENAVTGEVRVADNYIHGLEAQLSEAIVFDRVAADVHITGNDIDGAAQGGMFVIRPGGNVTVSHNTIRPGRAVEEGSLGNGMWLFGGSSGGSYTIEDNTILCENPVADGIILAGGSSWGEPVESAVVRRNTVTMPGTDFGGIALLDAVSNSYVGQNTVRGSGAYAIALWSIGPAAENNSLVGNNLSGFEPSPTQLFLSPNTVHTVVRGNSGQVWDFGEDNYITGVTPMKDAAKNGAMDRPWPLEDDLAIPGLTP